jgi:hypothetical protein
MACAPYTMSSYPDSVRTGAIAPQSSKYSPYGLEFAIATQSILEAQIRLDPYRIRVR